MMFLRDTSILYVWFVQTLCLRFATWIILVFSGFVWFVWARIAIAWAVLLTVIQEGTNTPVSRRWRRIFGFRRLFGSCRWRHVAVPIAPYRGQRPVFRHRCYVPSIFSSLRAENALSLILNFIIRCINVRCGIYDYLSSTGPCTLSCTS